MLTIHDTIQYEPGSSHLCSEGTQSVLSPSSLRFPAKLNVLKRQRQHAPVSRVEELFHYFSAFGDVNSLLSTS